MRSRKKTAAAKKIFGFFYTVEGKGRAYYFVLVDALKQTLLEAKLKQDLAFNVGDYGTVVASGYGTPTEAEKILLRDRYGADL